MKIDPRVVVNHETKLRVLCVYVLTPPTEMLPNLVLSVMRAAQVMRNLRLVHIAKEKQRSKKPNMEYEHWQVPIVTRVHTVPALISITGALI